MGQNWITNLRVTATFVVILLHTASPLVVKYGQLDQLSWMSANFYDGISRFCVPVFVMISGALLLGKEIEIMSFLKRRFVRIVSPFVFWTVVYLVFNAFVFKTIPFTSVISFLEKLFRAVWFGSSFHFWYVYMIIGLYLFIPIINRWVLTAAKNEMKYFLMIWGVTVLFLQPVIKNYSPAVDLLSFSGYLGYLVLGYSISKMDLTYLNQRKNAIIVTYLLSLLAIIAATYFFSSNADKFVGYFYDYFSFAVLINSVSLFVIFKIGAHYDFTKFRFVKDVNQYSYGVYLIHILVLNVFLEFGLEGSFIHPVMGIPLVAILCLLLSTTLIKYIKLLPYCKNISG